MADFDHLTRTVHAFHPNAIIDCAASVVQPSRIDWFDQIHLNVAATVALFQASCAIPACHFIHVSTGIVYGVQDRPCREGDPIDTELQLGGLTFHPYEPMNLAPDIHLAQSLGWQPRPAWPSPSGSWPSPSFPHLNLKQPDPTR